MERGVMDLSRYRLDKARGALEAAKVLLNAGDYEGAANRSYYAIFHALRAVTALAKFDAKKHSAVIAYFNRNYIKPGIFDKSLSRVIKSAFELRHSADYQDFYAVSIEQVRAQVGNAAEVIDVIADYLTKQFSSGDD